MPDEFDSHQAGLSSPAEDAFEITPNDGADVTAVTRGIWVGGAGDVAVTTKGGTTVTFAGAQAGSVIPIRASRVLATGTTATDLLGLV